MSKPNEAPRKALGKGLSALLPSRQAAPEPAEARPQPVSSVGIDQIDPNPLQPRHVFQPERLAELADSIKINGIIQPLIVQRRGGRYQLVAGERRWRAARLAELKEVPVVVREFADDRLLELALVENIQREDLNPIEVAEAMERLGKELKLSHEEIGHRTGKDRTTITNLLRLLKLPEHIQLLVAEQMITMGHARALLGVNDPDQQRDLADKIIEYGLSVRHTERMVQELNRAPEPASPKSEPPADPNVRAAMDELERVLGTKVRIVEKAPNRGKIEIEYFSQDELDRIYNLIAGQ